MNSKVMETWEAMNCWVPVKLISELVVQFGSYYEMGVYGYNQLCS
jgi:hypothetical protein